MPDFYPHPNSKRILLRLGPLLIFPREAAKFGRVNTKRLKIEQSRGTYERAPKRGPTSHPPWTAQSNTCDECDV